MDNPFSDEELERFGQEMFPALLHRSQPTNPFRADYAPTGLKTYVVHNFNDDVLADGRNEEVTEAIVAAMNVAQRALPMLFEWKWRRVEDELPPLCITFEDEDGDEHKHSETMLVAYVHPHQERMASASGHQGFLEPYHALGWLFQDGEWYQGDGEAPGKIQGVLAWMPLPTYVNPAASTCSQPPMTRDEQLQESMEGRR